MCGKIRNKELVSGAKAVFAAACCFLAVSVAVIALGVKGDFFEPCFSYSYYAALFENAAVGFAAGVILWKIGVWPAGDAKLYALVSAALPLIIPYAWWSPGTLFLTLLVNIFLPAAAVYLVQMSWEQLEPLFTGDAGSGSGKIFDRAAGAAAGFRRDPGKLGLFLLMALLFCFVGAWNSAQTEAFKINDSLFFVLMLAFSGRVGGYVARIGPRFTLVCFGATAICAALFPGFLGLTQLVLYGLVKSAQFTVFRWLLYMVADRHLASCGTYWVCPGGLRPGMIVSEKYLEQLKEAEPDFMDGWLLDKCRDGLTGDQISRLEGFLKNKSKDSKDEPGIPVFRVKPFAFWIALGAALTAALSGRHVLMVARFWLSWLWRVI